MTNLNIILSYYKNVDPKISKIMNKVDYDDWFRDRYKEKRDRNKYFHALCRAIIGQQLSGKAAGTIYSRFKDLLGGSVIPKAILKQKDQALRDVGMSWAKVSYVKDLAHKVKNKEVHLTKLDNMDDADVIEELTKIKGIGTWTVEMFLMFTLKRENVFSFGDLGLKKGISKVYGLDNPTKEQIAKIIAEWDPYKTYGSIALWESLE